MSYYLKGTQNLETNHINQHFNFKIANKGSLQVTDKLISYVREHDHTNKCNGNKSPIISTTNFKLAHINTQKTK